MGGYHPLSIDGQNCEIPTIFLGQHRLPAASQQRVGKVGHHCRERARQRIDPREKRWDGSGYTYYRCPGCGKLVEELFGSVR